MAAKVNFKINEGKKTISFEIAGIKGDVSFVPTDKLSTNHLANNIILGVQGGDIYFDHESEVLQSLLQKYDEGLLTLFVGGLALPTYSYNNGSRVILSQKAFFDVMDKVISAYAESIKPRELRKFFSIFMSAKKKKRHENAQKRYERAFNTNAVDIAYSLQHHGIISRNPYGDFDGLVINI